MANECAWPPLGIVRAASSLTHLVQAHWPDAGTFGARERRGARHPPSVRARPRGHARSACGVSRQRQLSRVPCRSTATPATDGSSPPSSAWRDRRSTRRGTGRVDAGGGTSVLAHKLRRLRADVSGRAGGKCARAAGEDLGAVLDALADVGTADGRWSTPIDPTPGRGSGTSAIRRQTRAGGASRPASRRRRTVRGETRRELRRPSLATGRSLRAPSPSRIARGDTWWRARHSTSGRSLRAATG